MAGVAVNRILDGLAWLGTAVVFVAAAVRILGWFDVFPVSARLDQYATYASWGGLALVVLYTLARRTSSPSLEKETASAS